jgi:hypothetical protein
VAAVQGAIAEVQGDAAIQWRAARCLLKLRDQVDAMAPRRNKASDGTIGDASHAASTSDHNPWVRDAPGPNVVTAIDITHDPVHGANAHKIVAAIVKSRDSRLKYLIWDRRIISSTVSPWVWRPYTGSNPHTSHFHLSVVPVKSRYDSTAPWRIMEQKEKFVRFELWAGRPKLERLTASGWVKAGNGRVAAKRAAFRARVSGRIVRLAFRRRRPFVKTVEEWRST